MNLQAEIAKIDILALAGQDTTLKRKANTNGGEYCGPCPFCGGRDRFQVWPKHPDGKGRFYCRGCERTGDAVDYKRIRDELTSNGEALAALGIETKSNGNGHASKNGKDKSGQVITRVHPYHDADGAILYEVVRFDNPKEYKPRDPGDPKFRPGVFSRHPRVLYRLPDVLDAVRSGDTVLLVEGEKTVEALGETGFIATTIPGGANGPWVAGFTETLTGADVVILPDQDRPGRQYAQRAARELHGKARSIKIIDLPGLEYRDTHGEDAEDWRTRGGTVAELNRLITTAPEWGSKPEHEIYPGWLTTDQVKAMPPIEYLIPEVLPKQSLSMIFAPSGAGKSFYAKHLSAILACEGHTVFYVVTEGQAGSGKRSAAWEQHNGVTIPPAKLLEKHEAINLLDGQQFGELLNAVTAHKPDLIVFDTLAHMLAAAGLDENSNTDMGRFINACSHLQQETGTAVLIIHHPIKSGGWERGAGALRGACDMIIELTNADGYVTVSCSKSKDTAPFKDRHYQLIPVEGTESCALVESEKVTWTESSKLSPSEQKALDVLALPSLIETGTKAAIVAKQAGIHENSIYRVLGTLMRRGFVSQDKKGEPYRLTDAGKQLVSGTDPLLADYPQTSSNASSTKY